MIQDALDDARAVRVVRIAQPPHRNPYAFKPREAKKVFEPRAEKVLGRKYAHVSSLSVLYFAADALGAGAMTVTCLNFAMLEFEDDKLE